MHIKYKKKSPVVEYLTSLWRLSDSVKNIVKFARQKREEFKEENGVYPEKYKTKNW